MAREREVVVESYQLTKVFRDFWRRVRVRALDHVDLQIYQGEVFGLLGPNGSGKSTFIKILLGLLFPSKGSVAIFGRRPRNVAVKERIGYLPEESYLYRYLNAEETLDFYGRLFRLRGPERQRRTAALLDMVGLTAQRRRPLNEYSKGMARRIGLAQALINDPDLLILDEPTTGLDPIGTREIKDLILEMKRRGKTVLLSSHLLADVEDICDRIAILYGGKVRREGGVKRLLQRQAVTQISADELKPETVAEVLDIIEEREGDKRVSVETPMDRLEDYFLRVVEEAREARVVTGGATRGGGFQEFFDGVEKRQRSSDEVLADLVTEEEGPQPPETAEEAPTRSRGPAGPDADLLQDLTAPTEEAEPILVEKDEAEPEVTLPTGSRLEERERGSDVLRDLVQVDEPDKKGDEKKGRDERS